MTLKLPSAAWNFSESRLSEMLAINCIGLYFICHNKAEGLVNVIAVTYAEKNGSILEVVQAAADDWQEVPCGLQHRFWWPWVTFRAIHIFQACSSVICGRVVEMTVVQTIIINSHMTYMNLTRCQLRASQSLWDSWIFCHVSESQHCFCGFIFSWFGTRLTCDRRQTQADS